MCCNNDTRVRGTDSPWVCGFPPGGCQQCPEMLQSSAGGTNRSKWKAQEETLGFRGRKEGTDLKKQHHRASEEATITHSDAGVISSNRHVVGASGGDQTHSQHHQSQSQQRHGHPQSRSPPAQVLSWGQMGGRNKATGGPLYIHHH